jgi:hypothetical protein
MRSHRHNQQTKTLPISAIYKLLSINGIDTIHLLRIDHVISYRPMQQVNSGKATLQNNQFKFGHS